MIRFQAEGFVVTPDLRPVLAAHCTTSQNTQVDPCMCVRRVEVERFDVALDHRLALAAHNATFHDEIRSLPSSISRVRFRRAILSCNA